MSVFTIAGNTLTPAGKIDFGDPKSGPSHVAFTPDGKMALVTRDGDNKVSILTVDGNKVDDSKMFMVGGIRPYSLEISSKGDVAVVGDQGGGQGDMDVINVIDLKAKPPRIVNTVSVGQTPEGVTMSHDGKYVAVTVRTVRTGRRTTPPTTTMAAANIRNQRHQCSRKSPRHESAIGVRALPGARTMRP